MRSGRRGSQSAAGTNGPAFARRKRLRPPQRLGDGCGTAILSSWRGLFPVNRSVQHDIQENQNEGLVKRDQMPEQKRGGEDHPGTSPPPHLYGGSDLGEFG